MTDLWATATHTKCNTKVVRHKVGLKDSKNKDKGYTPFNPKHHGYFQLRCPTCFPRGGADRLHNFVLHELLDRRQAWRQA